MNDKLDKPKARPLDLGGPVVRVPSTYHRTNMAKVGGPIVPNGKRLKPKGWQPPDIAGEIARQQGRSSAGSGR
jgi:hypothetical protein